MLAIPEQNITAQTIENEINDFVVVFNQERIDRRREHDEEFEDIADEEHDADREDWLNLYHASQENVRKRGRDDDDASFDEHELEEPHQNNEDFHERF